MTSNPSDSLTHPLFHHIIGTITTRKLGKLKHSPQMLSPQMLFIQMNCLFKHIETSRQEGGCTYSLYGTTFHTCLLSLQFFISYCLWLTETSAYRYVHHQHGKSSITRSYGSGSRCVSFSNHRYCNFIM